MIDTVVWDFLTYFIIAFAVLRFINFLGKSSQKEFKKDD